MSAFNIQIMKFNEVKYRYKSNLVIYKLMILLITFK